MRRAAIALLGLVLLVPACSLGPRQDWSDQIHDAAKVARRAGTAHVHATVALKVIETNIRQLTDPLYTVADGVVTFRDRRAKIVIDKPAGRKNAGIVYDDMLEFFPRSKASIGKSSRHWARFNFEVKPFVDIDANDRRLAIGVGAISPSLAVDLLEGVLTGSIKRLGAQTVSGVATTAYTAKLSLDAAVRDLRDERRRTGILRLFETIGAKDDIFPVSVWMQSDGRVRALEFRLTQRKDVVNTFRLTIRWEFSSYGAPATVGIPKPSDVAKSRRFRNFVGEVLRESV